MFLIYIDDEPLMAMFGETSAKAWAYILARTFPASKIEMKPVELVK